ncbi:AMP-dependent synthetase and ligase [Tolypothrix sp. NIES-4075]|uniref:AMP-binding protein n=1 Tax=Tolypothrix sp. NIES-4075 TaxID=2005459 RepID=UPI000B5CCB7B|nr:AMP-binding protein [Tolypothrix sp. NIES-4075]GAX42411.1 AMP-dependent synthetase and ligase [Tolypothrix sp. NIES-4075]
MLAKPVLKFSTLVELLHKRAFDQSDRTAYTFLEDGNREAGHLTYHQLERRAQSIAAQLQSLTATGSRALLLYPQGLEFIAAFCGCLYAGVIAIPAPPPDPTRLKRTLPRLEAIALNAGATLVLTTSHLMIQLEENSSQIKEFPTDHWLCTDKITEELAQEWQQPEISSDTLAYLQYTSGSTSTPKGVMVSHGNLMHHATSLQKACEYTSDSITVTWMPYFHDYGLVQGMILPLYTGTPCYLMSPFSFIRRPFHWLLAISRYRATHSQAPNFAYDQCIRRITPEQRAQLNLSSWQAAGIGAEPIKPPVMQEFIETFAPCGFRAEAFAPAYGLAEATLVVSSSSMGSPPVFCTLDAASLERNRVIEATEHQKMVRTIPGCGPLIGDTKVVIANPDNLTECEPDEVGEIWVANPSVALGYWQHHEETEKTFRAQLRDTQEGLFLRTGDLGFIKDGELFVTGRIKDLIIILGRNYYPQDIEFTVERSHNAVRSNGGAAFSVEVNGEERLVIVQEIERGQLRNLDTDEVMESIRQAVAQEHELPVYAVALIKGGSIPKTSSGKIQRRACQSAFLSGTLDVVAEWMSNLNGVCAEGGATGETVELLPKSTPIQKKIAAIWANCLVLPQVGLYDNFFILGGHSLHAVQIISEVGEAFSIDLPPSQLLESPTVASLSAKVEAALTRKRQQTQHKKKGLRTYQQFYWVVVSVVLLLVLSIASFNWVVDPYGVLNSPIVQGFNQLKPEQIHHERLFKAIEIIHLKPQIIFFGTSRTKRGLDPRHPIFHDQNTYNLAMAGATMYEIRRYFDHVLANQPNLKQVVLGLDYTSFAMNQKFQDDFDEGRLEQKTITLKDLISVLFSTDAFEDSLKTLAKNLSHSKSQKYSFFKGLEIIDDKKELPGSFQNFIQGGVYPLRKKDKYLLSEEQLKELKSLIEICHSRNIDLKLFISPIHATLLEVYRVRDEWSEIERWLRSIVKLTDVWDFSSYNSITTEEIKNQMQYYLDYSHYRKEVGNLILNRIFNFQQETVPRDFGVIITPDNIESHLAQINTDHAAWAKNHPQLVKLAQDLEK